MTAGPQTLIRANQLKYNLSMQRNIKRNLFPSLWLLVLLFSPSFSAIPARAEEELSRKEKIERLNETHRRWFNMVESISSREELNVFLQLDNHRDREIFIRTFWLQRDPTPGTSANEYRDEIEKRFQHVLHFFSRGSSKPPWKTDMGRFYMILGEPNTVSSRESSNTIYPTQIWSYYGDVSLGLPTYFTILFYRPHNTPEWKHYNPASEDPRSLIVQGISITSEDYSTIYSTLAEHSSEVASAAFTMVPDDLQAGLRPSWRSNFILSSIYESPQKKINIQYATNFLKYKGYVDMESSVNFIECTNLITVSRHERLGMNFINVALRPKKISVDFSREKNRYFYNFELTISVKKGEEFVYEQKKNYDFYLTGEEVERLKALGNVISDTFPIIPGEYKVLVFARNAVGKEFTYFEKDVSVRPDSDMPFLASPLVSYRLDDKAPHMLTPFQTDRKRININPENLFQVKEKPVMTAGVYNLGRQQWEKGSLSVSVKGLSERNPYNDTLTIPLNSQPYDKNLHYFIPLSGEGLYSDHYQVSVRLLSENQTILDNQSVNFTVAPSRDVPYPISSFKQASLDNSSYFYTVLGSQYQNAGDNAKAAEHFERALNSDPGSSIARIRWLQTLNQQGRFTQVMAESEPLKEDPENRFEYHLLRGNALFGMKEYQNALEELMAANKIYNSDVRVLNLLGLSFANLGDLAEGIKALEASLSIDPKQARIQKILAEMKEKLPSEPSPKNR